MRQLRRQILPGLFYSSEIQDENGELVLRGQRLPGFRAGAEAYERTFGETWRAGGAYDWLCNASHPTPTMLAEVSVAQADGARRFEIEDATYPCRLTRLALVSFLHAWAQVAEYIAAAHEAVPTLLVDVDGLEP